MEIRISRPDYIVQCNALCYNHIVFGIVGEKMFVGRTEKPKKAKGLTKAELLDQIAALTAMVKELRAKAN